MVLDGYKITKNIYQSESTEILRAIRVSDGLPVILKARNRLVSSKLEANLAHEYELGQSLDGEHSVRHLALEQTEQKTILVLHDDKMNSLKSAIPEGGFDLLQFFILAIEIVSGIEEIHSKNVIHRDINPANIIINSALDSVKVIDFELATKIREEVVDFEPLTELQGTVSYISPEQTGRINKPVDSRSDLYSLGITLFRMITGKLPFNTTNPGDLIYSHIARPPVPVVDIRQDIPQTVSRIIEKLLKKSPDERYQTATGVKNDLLFLKEAIVNKKKIIDFKPGQNEHIRRITLSGKLYGREKETASLLDCFLKCCDAGRVITVTGPAGIGKTALIRELYAPITTEKGFFLSGKFDLQSRDVAYTAIADALKNFVEQCLGLDGETREVWRTTILSSVGGFGQVLTDIVPEFKNLIGNQPNIAPVSPLETVARRNLVFSNLIMDICSVGSSVIFFLDDLQWADSTTLSLLEKIIEINPKRLLIILSYRDNEISPTHPTKLFLDNIHDMDIAFTNLHMTSLPEEAVNDWTNDILPDASQAAKELADMVLAKTEGNPFYITSLLHLIIEKNYIKFKKDGTLSLDIDAVSNIPTNADIVEHLIKKIETLEERDREFLIQVSILGNRFSMDTIDHFLKEKQDRYLNSIQALVGARLLVKRGKNLMFTHDRVLRAAHALLDDEKASTLHLKAGQNIRTTLNTMDLADIRIDDYIHHYNAAADLITDGKQRLELAKLNTMLGKRLKNNAAYQAAENSFAWATTFLPPKPFETDYHMTVDLFTEYGEALFLNLKYEDGEKQFDTVIAHSKSPLDSANAYCKQIFHHASHHNLKKSMKIALHALEALNIKLPKRILKITFFTNFIKIKGLLKNKKPEDILDFPVTEDPLVLAQMNVLAAAAVPAYLGFPDYWPIIIFKMMGITIDKGISSVSSFACGSYAVVLCNLGDADNGYSYGKTALALMEKLNAKQLFTKLYSLFGAMIHHWKASASGSIAFLEKAIASGLETGDYEFASLAACTSIRIAFYTGSSIENILNQLPDLHRILNGFGKDHSISIANYFHQFLIVMNDPTGDGITVSGDISDENRLLPLLEERKNLTSLAFCILTKMQLTYLARDYETANNNRVRAVELLKAVPGSIYNPVCHFFAALTCIAYYKEYRKDTSLLRDAKHSLKKLRKWGTDAPENYLYKAQLVEAELLSIKGKQSKTLKLYEEAIRNAGKAKNNLDLGIACECMGRYLISIGLDSLGLMHIRRSIAVFHNWGALNKSTRLEKEYIIEFSKNSILPESTDSSSSSQSINTTLNLEALTGTIKLLTSHLKFDSLLATLLDAVMQRSGATRVVYIHVNQGNLQVKAEKVTAGNVRIYDGDDILPASIDLPSALLEKCYSDSCEYVLKNLELERKIGKSEQHESRFKSILIISLTRHQSVMGLVYLENDLMEDAFRKDHIHFLSLLAGQAAIAMENALVFEHLNAERDYSSNIIKNSPSLICGIDGNGITTFINPVIEKITGYRKDELIGENWWELFYPGEEYLQVDRLFKIFEGGEVADYEMRLTCKNGEKKDIIWNSFTKRDNKNFISEIIGFGNDITNNKIIEMKLQKSETKFRGLIESSSDWIWEVDEDGVYTYVSPQVETMLGYKPEEVLGKTPFHLMPPEEAAQLSKVFKNVAKKGKSIDAFENINLHKDGRHIIMEISGVPVFNEAGKVTGYRGVDRDITERKQAEALLKKSEKKFKAVFNNTFEFMGILTPDGVLTEANQTALDFGGLKESDVVGKLFWETIWWEHSMELQEWLRMAINRAASGEFVRDEVYNIAPDGSIHHVDFSIKPVTDNEGNIIFLVPEGRDITERKQAEEAMRESEERWHSLTSNTKDLIQILDTKGNIVYMNRVYPPHTMEEVIGKSVFEFTDDKYKQITQMSIDNILAGEGPQTFETAIHISESNIAQFEIKYVPMLTDGKVDKIISLVMDIKEKKQTEKELHQLRNYLFNIINSMPSVLVGVDIDARVTQWNKTAEQTTGITADEAQGKNLIDVFPQMALEMEKITKSIQTGETKQEQKKFRQTENDICYEDVTIYPLIANGVEGAVIRIDDVTEQVRLEEMMIQSEKMLSVGGLAAGMAHEINNPLAGIMQTANVMANRLDKSANIPANLKAAEEAGTTMEAIKNFMEVRGILRMITTIMESGRRVAAIVDNMLSFARKSDSAISSHDMANLLDRTLELASTDFDLKKHYDFKLIKIRKEYEDNLPSVPCEGAKVQQVLLNIFRNGAQAMQEAGTENPLFIVRSRFEKKRKMICMEIEDNGPGMDETTRKRVFEPFYTTKPVGVGTGLGMSVSYFIITENHGGEMTVESRPGYGANFIIRLPLNE